MTTREERLGIVYSAVPLANGSVAVRVTPPPWAGVGDGETIVLSRDQYRRFCIWRKEKTLIQNELPDLTKDQREILLTGIGPKEWDRLWEEKE